MTTQAVQEPRKDGSGLEPGQVVGGKFRLERFVARGGMGSVWAATHLVLAAPVAIKFLDRLRGGDSEEIELRVDRFRFEAQISARLAAQTKHMVAVHDAGMHLGMPYLVMEFAPGKSLQDLLDERGRLTPASLVPVVEQIGEALDAAHRQGIVHRDVKPGNILFLEPRGSAASDVFVKLTDFGVAKPADGTEIDLVAPKQTAEGLVVGSPAYMSPEQIAGVGFSTGASDLWSLGVVLYEAITGWLPFRGESLTDFAIGITTRQADAPSSVVDGLSPAIDEFFVKALAKQSALRFATGVEMAAAFRRALDDPQGHVVAGLPDRRGSWVWFAAVGALVAVLGGAWLVVGDATDEPRPGTAEAPTPPSTEAGSGDAATLSPPTDVVPDPPATADTSAASAVSSADAAPTTPRTGRARPPRGAKTTPPTTTASRPPDAVPPTRTTKPLDPSEVH